MPMNHADALHALTWVAATAAVLGVLMLRFRQPPMLGFMLAGLALGPTGFAFVENGPSIRTFAELGVLLLLFVVGLEISLRSLRRVFLIAAACALIQATVAITVTMALGAMLSWPWSQSLVVGFVLSLSSTAAGIKLLESVGEARREAGRLAVSVLVAQDVLVIPMLIITAALGAAAATNGVLNGALVGARVVLAVVVLAGIIWFLSRRERIKIPFADALAANPDAAPLAALAFCLVCATAASFAGVSPIFGAFIAGLILGASNVRADALRVSVPIQAILLMVFFLSIGLMLDLRTLAPRLPAVILIAVAVLAAKTVVNASALRLLRAPPREALVAAVAMAPLGEFGFVLAAAGLAAGAVTDEGYQIALAVIAVSLAASPLWMLTARRAVEHRETEAATVRAFFAEIFAEELARARAACGGAANMTRAATRTCAKLARQAAKSAQRVAPAPANDQGPEAEGEAREEAGDAAAKAERDAGR